ncbi:VanZ family protein [Bacillus sp. BHET2]|uniref:VanZ family protein n=1 Tax=Bacillus sp. BHET2 TaxID=2583818 RepID=UPI001485CCD5|nr:VanZ family protein [Bacillus sp. BHET2]
MNKIVVVIYMGILFCLTCTESLHEFVEHQALTFQWTGDPELKSFINFTDYPFSNPSYIKQKVGHAFCFFWLAYSFILVLRNQYMIFFCSVSYALFTESAQLFFSRTGCLLDVGYDTAGILMFFVVYRILHWRVSPKSTLQPNKVR